MEDQETKNKADIRQWHRMTGEDFRKLDKSRCVVLVSCSPMEVHGPHLPVMTDCAEAEAIGGRIIEYIGEKRPGTVFLRLPIIYTATDVLPHTGSLFFRCSTEINVLKDLGRTLSKQGFRDIWVANFHGGARHVISLEVAANKVNKKYGTRMISLFTFLVNILGDDPMTMARMLGHIEGLDAESLDMDLHAGVVETAMMLHLMPETVDGVYKNLERMTPGIKLAEQGKPPLSRDFAKPSLTQAAYAYKTFERYFMSETFSGKPAISTPEMGEQILEAIAKPCAAALNDWLDGKIPVEKTRSKLWPYRRLLTSDLFGDIFQRILGIHNPIF